MTRECKDPTFFKRGDGGGPFTCDHGWSQPRNGGQATVDYRIREGWATELYAIVWYDIYHGPVDALV